MSKYKNQKCEYDGITFDSKRELARYCELKVLVRAGMITDLERHVVYELAPPVDLAERKLKPALRYVADFRYYDKEKRATVVEDVKSPVTRKTEGFRIKKHLMAWRHGIIIVEVS